MINSTDPYQPSALAEPEAIDVIVNSGPSGAIVLASLATAVVVILWFAFYVFVFLSRAATP